MNNNRDKYYIDVDGQKVEVSRELYKAYESMDNAEKYRTRCYLKHCISWNDDNEVKNDIINGVLASNDNPKDIVIEQENDEELAAMIKLMNEKLRELSHDDQDLIRKIYYEGKTDGDVAKTLGITRVAVLYRRNAALKKLKKLMER